MKVLSLLQPWATLVVMGAKKIETRSWNTKYRGELLIHASVNKKLAKELTSADPFNRFIRHWTDLPFGSIIGKCKLINTCSTDRTLFTNRLSSDGMDWELTSEELAFGDYTENRFCWLLNDAVQFAQPIPAKGSLGLWDYELPDHFRYSK